MNIAQLCLGLDIIKGHSEMCGLITQHNATVSEHVARTQVQHNRWSKISFNNLQAVPGLSDLVVGYSSSSAHWETNEAAKSNKQSPRPVDEPSGS